MKVGLKKRDGNLVVTLGGALDERSEDALAAIRDKLAGAHVVFDCDAVASINSRGFRGWLRFLGALDKQTTFELTRCPPGFIEYCNLLPATSFADRITSLTVPFTCDGCRAQVGKLYDVEDVSPDAELELAVCPNCNGTLAPAVAADSYFEFKAKPQR